MRDRPMPMTDAPIPIKAPPSASLESARAWARQRSAVRLAEVDAYLSELWRLATRLGYDPALVAAQSSLETDGWTAEPWRTRLNPVRLGIDEVTDRGLHFRSGIDAARAHLVHLSAFVRGYEPRLQPFIAIDPCWQTVFESGAAGRARHLDDLVPAWTADLAYPDQVSAHLTALRDAIQTPTPTPQTSPGGAALPPGITRLPTGNWRDRLFGQAPVAIVFHVADAADYDRALAWYRNPVSRASMHVVVDRDGALTQLVSATRAAWANSDGKNPRRDIRWLSEVIAKCRTAGDPMTLDDFTLAVAYVGGPTEPPTEQQYRSLVALAAYWRDRFRITPNRGRLLRHSDINSVDRAHCPGHRFDLTRIILALGGDPDIYE